MMQNVAKHLNSNHKDTKSKKVMKIGCNLCDQRVNHEKHSNNNGNVKSKDPKQFVCKKTSRSKKTIKKRSLESKQAEKAYQSR